MARSGGIAERHPAFGVLVVGLGTLVVPFDSSVNVAFPHIIRGFDLPIPSIQWVVIAYTLTYAALTLVFGRVGDILGYRRIFQFGNVSGAVAFVLCAAAPGFGWLLGARVLQGVGAALVLSCGPALATGLYPEEQRTRVLGFYTMMFGIGGALGPILAGELVRVFDWPAVFWFRAPIAVLAFALSWLLPGTNPRGQQRFDSIGAALLVLAITGLLLTLNQLRALHDAPWACISAAIFTVLCGAAFIWRELRAAQPIINVRFFRDPDFALVTAAHAILNLAGFSVMLLVPFYLDQIGGLAVAESGFVLASSPIGVMLSGPLAGRLAGMLSARRLASLGATVMLAAQCGIAVADAPVNIPLLAGWMFLQGVGLGLFQVACFDISTATIPRADRGVAGSLVMMTRTVGVVTGATVLMLIFQAIRAGSAAHGACEQAAFLAGFHAAFQIAASFTALVIIGALWRRWPSKQ
jgi:MFS family permease